jgi:hypothetical protein
MISDVKWLVAAMLLAPLAWGAAAAAEEPPERAFRGKRLAEANCGVCHSIAQFDSSTVPGVPPFREIAARTSAPALLEMLRGPVFLDHPEVPDFEPTEEQARDLQLYFLSISAVNRGN